MLTSGKPLRPGQDMARARAMRFANGRTRVIVRLLNSAPPLQERHRYAIAQALAETTVWTDDTPADARSDGGAVEGPTEAVPDRTAIPVCAGCQRPVTRPGGRDDYRHFDKTPICEDMLGNADPVWVKSPFVVIP